MTKKVIEEGVGALADVEDIIYYKHETRFDNGQLVDLDERRKVADKFPLNDLGYHDFLRATFLTMRKGEIAYIELSPYAHRDMYHKSFESLSPIRTAEEKAKIIASVGKNIWIKVTIA